MKLYEVEIPEEDEIKENKKESDTVDHTQTVPFADGAEKYRGKLVLLLSF
jgi:hypothetical protein